ncbi:hypothetical protein TK78_00240 [Streptomyces sp. Tue 6075]|nr:hypothetical protein TK78_00240 [Streptomyces sp. Tue 6075]
MARSSGCQLVVAQPIAGTFITVLVARDLIGTLPLGVVRGAGGGVRERPGLDGVSRRGDGPLRPAEVGPGCGGLDAAATGLPVHTWRRRHGAAFRARVPVVHPGERLRLYDEERARAFMSGDHWPTGATTEAAGD